MNKDPFNKKTTFFVIVKPNARKTGAVEWNEQKKSYIIEIGESPEDNKANIELLKFIGKSTGKKAKILSGATSKKKLIRLETIE